MQQLYFSREAPSLFRYAGLRIFIGWMLLTPFHSFSQATSNTGQPATNNNTTTPNTTGINLPNLISFTAALSGQQVSFNWITSYEENLSDFIVQRSTDGKSYEDRAVVFSDGNTVSRSQYVFTDNISELEDELNSATLYYRLKVVDLNGQTAYSQTLVVQFSEKGAKPALVTYPNPATSSLTVILPVGWENKPISYNVYNSDGRLVLQKSGSSSGRQETVNISGLHFGLYLLRVVSGNQLFAQSFVKVN